jgi:23S rRNA G2445 N2-methylase RlmL
MLLVFIAGLSIGFAIGTIFWTIWLAGEEHNEDIGVCDPPYDSSEGSEKLVNELENLMQDELDKRLYAADKYFLEKK